MCRVFSVSRSGYYRWRCRPESRRAIESRRLDAHIKAIFKKHKGRYGSPKITDELNDMGFPVGKNRVARRMKENGLRSIVHNEWGQTLTGCCSNPQFQIRS
jgi:putative transposase